MTLWHVSRRRLLMGAMLIGIAVGFTIVILPYRQNRLDAMLLNAIRHEDTGAALAALDDGANANAVEWIGPSPSPDLFIRDLRFWLHGHRPPGRGFLAPALYLVYTGRWDQRTFRRTYTPPENVPLVRALLEHGADPNFHPGRAGPLYFAVRVEHHETVRLLLEHGANPNVQDDSRSVPLMYADLECARLLLKHGAQVNGRGYLGQTPLMAAAADPRPLGKDKIALLLQHGADVNARDQYGQTALMHATDTGRARLLLAKGADVNARNDSGTTALMMVCANYVDPNLPRLLLQYGADVSLRDNRGKSARDYAAAYGNAKNKSGLYTLLKAAEAQAQKTHAPRLQ